MHGAVLDGSCLAESAVPGSQPCHIQISKPSQPNSSKLPVLAIPGIPGLCVCCLRVDCAIATTCAGLLQCGTPAGYMMSCSLNQRSDAGAQYVCIWPSPIQLKFASIYVRYVPSLLLATALLFTIGWFVPTTQQHTPLPALCQRHYGNYG